MAAAFSATASFAGALPLTGALFAAAAVVAVACLPLLSCASLAVFASSCAVGGGGVFRASGAPRRQRDAVGAVPGEQAGGLLAWRVALQLDRRAADLGDGPAFGAPAGDGLDVVLRLLRQLAFLRQPIVDAFRPGVVGGGGEAEIAEAVREIS